MSMSLSSLSTTSPKPESNLVAAVKVKLVPEETPEAFVFSTAVTTAFQKLLALLPVIGVGVVDQLALKPAKAPVEKV